MGGPFLPFGVVGTSIKPTNDGHGNLHQKLAVVADSFFLASYSK